MRNKAACPRNQKEATKESIWERREQQQAAQTVGSGIMQGLVGHVSNLDVMLRAMGSQSV